MEEQYQAFLRVLDPQDNQTGGGAASAVAGAMAAALVGMVARVSVGKKNMPEPDAYYQEMDRQAQALSARLLAGSQADSAAFDLVMAAYRLPKATEEEKQARAAAIEQAMQQATRTPLENASACLAVLDLAAPLQGRSNPNASSDLECAVYLAQAGLRGALSNARINLPALKDAEAVARFSAEYAALEQRLPSGKNE